MGMEATLNAETFGKIIRQTRKDQGLTQEQVALACGTGLRFIIDLEKGKPTCELEKSLLVLRTLGITAVLSPPFMDESRRGAPRKRRVR